jgi:hypothetical protein
MKPTRNPHGTPHNGAYVHRRLGRRLGLRGAATRRSATQPLGPVGLGAGHIRAVRYEKCHDERGLWRFYVSGPCLVVGDSVGSRLPLMGNSKHLLVVGSFHRAPQRPFLSLIEREETGSRLISAGPPHGTSHNSVYVHRRLGRRLGLRGAATRRSATQPLGPVGLGAGHIRAVRYTQLRKVVIHISCLVV